jgi:hypothetical protein
MNLSSILQNIISTSVTLLGIAAFSIVFYYLIIYSGSLSFINILVFFIIFHFSYCALGKYLKKTSNFLESFFYTCIFILWPIIVVYLMLYISHQGSYTNGWEGLAYLLYGGIIFITTSLTALIHSCYVGITAKRWNSLGNTLIVVPCSIIFFLIAIRCF